MLASNRLSRSGCLFALFLLIAEPPFDATGLAGQVPYSDCGQLVQEAGFPPCILFHGSDGAILYPSSLGGLGAGDQVCVSGSYNTMSAIICNGTPYFTLNVDEIHHFLTECGTLTDQGTSGCLHFENADGDRFALANSGTFQPGAQVHVGGLVTGGQVDCGGVSLPLVENNSIGLCVARTGRLARIDGCVSFLAHDGEVFELEAAFEFDNGDFVSVTGHTQSGLDGPCGHPLLIDNTITAAFGGAGTIIQTPECGLAFRADAGGFGQQYLLSNYGGLQPGDRAYVTGAFDLQCSPPASCVAACLSDNTIGPLFDQCGTLLAGPGDCARFDPDGDATPLAMEFTNDLPIGASVFVTGVVEATSPACPGSPELVLRHNTADPCLIRCGTFFNGFECTPILLAEDGNVYWLENVGPFGVDDTVMVKGGINSDCQPLCPYFCLRSNRISLCPLDSPRGDLNADGQVTVDDIGLFVTVLLGLDDDLYRVFVSDTNIDEHINGQDVTAFIQILLLP